jgi:hypothetical protein
VTQLSTALNREYATITPFGAGALIAGGETNQEAYNNAVVYSGPIAGSFSASIPLPSGQRQQHAAVALADGRVLLVGGATDKNHPVLGIDVLTPATGTPTTSSAIGALHVGRISPTALALPNGQVFIGGGFDPTTLAPVASAEWLAPDLRWLGMQTLCGAAAAQGFAATAGGAVLAVMGQPATPTCSNVSVVLPSGVQQAPPLDPAPTLVRLFTGAQASPVLLTDVGALRWNPWSAAFTPLGTGTAGLTLPTSTTIAATSGLALWLGTDDNVWLLRFDTHGEYATDVAHGPYLLTDDEFTAPDQLAGPDASVSFSPASAATLSNGATVWLTDATFAGVTASVTLPVGGAATLVLRDPSGNEVACSATGVAARSTLTVVRSGSTVTMSIGDAGPGSPCSGSLDAGVRVSVGLAGPPPDGGVSTVQALSVTR